MGESLKDKFGRQLGILQTEEELMREVEDKARMKAQLSQHSGDIAGLMAQDSAIRGSVAAVETALTGKLNLPAGEPAVGKTLKITSVEADGSFTCEWAEAEARKVSHWKGAKISVVGDSISSFAGHVPSGNRAYYSSTNIGMKRYADIWYNVMAAQLGAEILVSDSWSGSSVTPGKCNRDDDVAGCSTLRTSRLALDGVQPDAIILAIGLNDFINNAPLGAWDALFNVPEQPDNFCQAYVHMVRMLRQNYPKAAIIAITPWFAKRGSGNRSGVYRNAIDLTVGDYAAVIHDMAQLMGFEVIDGHAIGFHKWNYTPEYCQDTASDTHPNTSGHRVMGLAVAEQMKAMYAGFVGDGAQPAAAMAMMDDGGDD